MTPEHIARVEAKEAEAQRVYELYHPKRSEPILDETPEQRKRGEIIESLITGVMIAVLVLVPLCFMIVSLAALPFDALVPVLLGAILIAVALK